MRLVEVFPEYLTVDHDTVSANAPTTVKASPGLVVGFALHNQSASTTAYLQIHNVASGSVAAASTMVYSCPLPAGVLTEVQFRQPIRCSGQVTHRITTGLANDTNSSETVVGNIRYT